MQELQDQCLVTPYDDLDTLFKTDIEKSISEIFCEFDPIPLGSASLAQVHKATLRPGIIPSNLPQTVAVKIQHPPLLLQAPADIHMCSVLVKWAKYMFPDFRLGWLAEEMRISLPDELDFNHETANARKIAEHLKHIRGVRIPNVYMSTKRILIMECTSN